MEPTLHGGELVRLEPVGEPCRYAVVAFETAAGGLMIHRVVESHGGRLVCRGDNRLDPDPMVAVERVIGQAVAVVDHEGRRLRELPAVPPPASRRWLRLTQRRSRRLVAEVELLARQAAGRRPAPLASPAVVRGDDRRRRADEGEATWDGALDWAAVEWRDGLPCVPPGARPDSIAAALLSQLPPAVRRRLVVDVLTAAQGREVRVEVYGREKGQRLVRAFALTRWLLARFGVAAGRPWDTGVPVVAGAPFAYAHFFDEAELRAELAPATVVSLRREEGPPARLVAVVRAASSTP
jgi:hypothetical protein